MEAQHHAGINKRLRAIIEKSQLYLSVLLVGYKAGSLFTSR